MASLSRTPARRGWAPRCIAAAAVYFVAANWQALGRYAKFALVEGAARRRRSRSCAGAASTRSPGRAALFVAALLTGVLLALVGQVYQTGADTFELFAAWALLHPAVGGRERQPALWLLVDRARRRRRSSSTSGPTSRAAIGVAGSLFAPRAAIWWIVFALRCGRARSSGRWLRPLRGGWLRRALGAARHSPSQRRRGHAALGVTTSSGFSHGASESSSLVALRGVRRRDVLGVPRPHARPLHARGTRAVGIVVDRAGVRVGISCTSTRRCASCCIGASS